MYRKRRNIFRMLWDAVRLRIIDRYIIAKFLKTYFFAIGMIIIIVVIFDAAEKIDNFLKCDASISEIITGYYANFIPYFVNQFSGLFTFIAVIFFTSKMAYNTEIIAILSAGVGFRRLMYPYFISATLITVLSLALNLYVIPEANTKRIEFDRKYTISKGNKAETYDRYIYRQVEPNTFAFVRDFSDNGHKAAFFTLETYKDGRVVSSLQAQNASYNLKKKTWVAPRYTIRTYDENDRDSLFKSTEPLDTLINLSSAELGKVEDLVQTLNYKELNEFIAAQRHKGSDMVSLFEVERQSRFAYPFSAFVLTLIGVALSSRKVRGGMGTHIGVGIALCFSYIMLMRFAAEFAKSGALPTVVAIWASNIIYLFVGIYLYIKAPK